MVEKATLLSKNKKEGGKYLYDEIDDDDDFNLLCVLRTWSFFRSFLLFKKLDVNPNVDVVVSLPPLYCLVGTQSIDH